MGGVLVLAAGIEPAFTDHDFTVLVLSYVVMRIAMVAQWLRASRAAGESRRATRIYAIGIAIVQVFWLLQLALPEPISWAALIVLIAAELAIPIIAERIGSTPWHPHHITERYGLFTLILLGESLLASANAIIEALHTGEDVPALIGVSVLTLISTAALWWLYFWPPHYRAISSFANSLRYGYVHYFVFAAAGALSTGIEILIDTITGHTRLSAIGAALTLSVPIAVFILGIWWIALRQNADRIVNAVVPAGAILIVLGSLTPLPVALIAAILVLVVMTLVIRPPLDTAHRQTSGSPSPRGTTRR
jgi:low temperature requirement protein LtrA